MTKEQLKEQLEELQNKVEQLENDVDYWEEYANDIAIQKEELEETLKYMVEKTNNVISDVNNFKFKLKINNLLTIERLKYELNFDDFILEDGKPTLEEVKSNLIEWFKTNDKSFSVDFYKSKHDYDNGYSAFTYKIYKIEERW